MEVGEGDRLRTGATYSVLSESCILNRGSTHPTTISFSSERAGSFVRSEEDSIDEHTTNSTFLSSILRSRSCKNDAIDTQE